MSIVSCLVPLLIIGGFFGLVGLAYAGSALKRKLGPARSFFSAIPTPVYSLVVVVFAIAILAVAVVKTNTRIVACGGEGQGNTKVTSALLAPCLLPR